MHTCQAKLKLKLERRSQSQCKKRSTCSTIHLWKAMLNSELVSKSQLKINRLIKSTLKCKMRSTISSIKWFHPSKTFMSIKARPWNSKWLKMISTLLSLRPEILLLKQELLFRERNWRLLLILVASILHPKNSLTRWPYRWNLRQTRRSSIRCKWLWCMLLVQRRKPWLWKSLLWSCDLIIIYHKWIMNQWEITL